MIPFPLFHQYLEHSHTWANRQNDLKVPAFQNSPGIHHTGDSPASVIMPPAPAEAGNLLRPDDEDQRYEQRDHRSECEQILHAGAF